MRLGYVYIYLSNEEDPAPPVDVFFDDFKITQTHSPVVQKGAERLEIIQWIILAKSQDAGGLPFGLSFNSYSRAAITEQNFKFNGGSEVEKMTDWYSTPFRKYDPSLGRFHGVDALASKYSSLTPSHFAANNPINLNDPTGLDLAPKAFEYLASDTDAVGSSLAGLENGPGGTNDWARAGNIGRFGRGGSLYNKVYGSFTPGAGYYFAKHAIATFLKRAFSSYVGDFSYKNFVTGEFFFSDGFNLQAKQPSSVGGIGPVDIELPFGGSENLIVGVGADHSYGGFGGSMSSLYSTNKDRMGSSGGIMPKMDPYFDGLTWDDIDGEYYDGGGSEKVEDDSNRLALFLLAATVSGDMAGQLFDDVMRNLRHLTKEGAMFDLDYSKSIAKASKWQKGIKIGGFVVAAVGVGVTYSDYKSGKIGLTEAVIDGTFGAVGSIPHPAAAGISIIYFSGKGTLEAAEMDIWNFRVGAYGRIYNQKTGKTVRLK